MPSEYSIDVYNDKELVVTWVGIQARSVGEAIQRAVNLTRESYGKHYYCGICHIAMIIAQLASDKYERFGSAA